MGKFDKWVYEFTPDDANWGDWSYGPQAFLHGEKDLEGARLYAGFQVIKAPVLMDAEPIFHREEENMFFLGASLPDVFSSFDAEIHFYMGKTLETLEKIVITEPTVVRVPKGYWHGPLNFVRVDKPLLYQAALFSGRPGSVRKVDADGTEMMVFSENETHRYPVENKFKSVKWTAINEDGVDSYTGTGAYDESKAVSQDEACVSPTHKSRPYSDATTLKAPKPALTPDIAKSVVPLPKEITDWGNWMPNPKTYFRGATYMEDATYHIGWQIFTGANDMEEAHFHQGVDEYLFFMGANPMDMFDFDAEIEILMGEDPDHMETIHINKPTVIRFPANTWHCPIKFRKMNKPILFQAAFQDGIWGTITRSAAGQGTIDKGYFSRKYTYDYMGDNVRFCKFDETKRCNICGACFPRFDDMKED